MANCRTVSKLLSDGRSNSSLSRAKEYIDSYCKTGEIIVKDDEITNEIDGTIENIMSTATEGVMSTNKSSDEYAHDIKIWWREADSRQNKTSVTVVLL